MCSLDFTFEIVYGLDDFNQQSHQATTSFEGTEEVHNFPCHQKTRKAKEKSCPVVGQFRPIPRCKPAQMPDKSKSEAEEINIVPHFASKVEFDPFLLALS